MNLEALVIEAIALLEQAKVKIETARNKDQVEAANMLDGRALSIAITHLETAQLWVANARR